MSDLSPSQLEVLRRGLLLQLEAAAPVSLSLETLSLGVRTGGFSLSAQAVSAQLDYLVGKNLAEAGNDALSTAHTRWKLTSSGRDYLERNHLIV